MTVLMRDIKAEDTEIQKGLSRVEVIMSLSLGLLVTPRG